MILKKFGYNLDLTKIVFAGGGSTAIQHFGMKEGKKVLFYSDIHENAKGCEMAVRSILKEIAKKRAKA